MHAFDLATLAGSEIRVRRARPGETITTLDGVERTLDRTCWSSPTATARRRSPASWAARHSEVSATTTTVVVRERVLQAGVGAPNQQAARPEDRGVVALRARRGHQRRAGRRDAARDRADGADRRGQGGRVRLSIATPSDSGVRRLHLRRAAAGPRCSARRCPTRKSSAFCAGSGSTCRRPPTAGTSSRRPSASIWCAKSISIEEVGRHHGLRQVAADVPGASAARPAARSAHRARSAGAAGLTAAGLSEAVTFGFIEAKAIDVFRGTQSSENSRGDDVSALSGDSGFEAFCRSRTRSPPSSTRCGRRCCRAWWTRSRTTGVTAGATCGCSKSARGSRRTARRAASPWHGPGAPATTGRAARATWTSSTSRAWSSRCARCSAWPSASSRLRRPFWCRARPRRSSSPTVPDAARGSASIGQLSPAIADARGLPRQDRVIVAELDLDHLSSGANRRERRQRSAAAASVRRARSVDRRRGYLACGNHSWHHSCGRTRSAGAARLGGIFRSLSGQGRAGRRRQHLGAADVPGGRSHVDRRRGAAERRQDSRRARSRARGGSEIGI